MSKWILILLALGIVGAWLVWQRAQAQTPQLEPGNAAPDFTLPAARGGDLSLADLRGEWVVLYFYPKDDTPGCTKEACNFRDGYLELRALDAQVVGVSLDNRMSHVEFQKKYSLPFPLLSDSEGEVARAYGALFELGPLRLAKRHSFIIDPEGKLARVYRSVDPDSHTEQVLADLQALREAEQ